MLENIQLNDAPFWVGHSTLDLLFKLRYVFFGVMYYYREKVIVTLLNNGVELHVYGDSWKASYFAKYWLIKIHPSVTGDDVLKVMAKSKISLNIMAWHKDGFTERIANSMLNGSVVVFDTSTQLEELFVNNKDLVLFNLSNLNDLLKRIKNLLSSPENLKDFKKWHEQG